MDRWGTNGSREFYPGDHRQTPGAHRYSEIGNEIINEVVHICSYVYFSRKKIHSFHQIPKLTH